MIKKLIVIASISLTTNCSQPTADRRSLSIDEVFNESAETHKVPIGTWKQSHPKLFESESVLQILENGIFTFNEQAHHHKQFTKGKWTMQSNFLVLSSIDSQFVEQDPLSEYRQPTAIEIRNALFSFKGKFMTPAGENEFFKNKIFRLEE